MNVSRRIMLFTAMILLAAPANGQVKQSKTQRELEKQKIINTEREVSAVMSRDGNAAMWVDVSAAPADFPFPVFRGTQTKMMRINVGQAPELNRYARQLTLSTRDPAASVAQWYRKYLPGAGYKLDDKMPAQTSGGRAYVLKGESQKFMAMISIIMRDDANGPASQIQLTATTKPNDQAKK